MANQSSAGEDRGKGRRFGDGEARQMEPIVSGHILR